MGFVCSSVAWDDDAQEDPERRPKDATQRPIGWRLVLRTVPVPLETIIVACSETIFDGTRRTRKRP
jgi:hypothetical protein